MAEALVLSGAGALSLEATRTQAATRLFGTEEELAGAEPQREARGREGQASHGDEATGLFAFGANRTKELSLMSAREGEEGEVEKDEEIKGSQVEPKKAGQGG
jgi:hypothetical protein